jgi:hypothetical protein
MQASAAIVTSGSHHQNALLGAQLNRALQDWVRLTKGRELATTDIDDMRSLLDGLLDGPCQIEL